MPEIKRKPGISGDSVYQLVYSIRHPSHVLIELTDGVGYPAELLSDNIQQPGSYSLTVDLDDYFDTLSGNGTMYCRITIQSSTGRISIHSLEVSDRS